MQKVIIQFVISVALFFGVWWSLSRVEFINPDQVRKIDSVTEKKLGELILKAVQATDKELRSPKIRGVIDTLAGVICKAQGTDPRTLKIYVVQKEDVNAFALPDRQIVVYSGLIKYARSPEEVAGVLAHELGHISKNHVMKKMAKELGISMIFTLAGNNSGFEIVKDAARTLSSSAFDRSQEEEADDYAFQTLIDAQIDPEQLANFLFRLSKEANNVPEELVWLSTHPDTKERAADILKKRKGRTVENRPPIHSTWASVQASLDAQ